MRVGMGGFGYPLHLELPISTLKLHLKLKRIGIRFLQTHGVERARMTCACACGCGEWGVGGGLAWWAGRWDGMCGWCVCVWVWVGERLRGGEDWLKSTRV